MYRHLHNTETGSGKITASPAGILCLVSIVAACMHTTLWWHFRCLLWRAITLIDVAIGEVGPCDEWLPLWVATQIMVSTDETFLPCSSPYRFSHWIGRSMSDLRTYCCHWGGRRFVSSHWVYSLWIVFELMNDTKIAWKIGARSGLQNVNVLYKHLVMF